MRFHLVYNGPLPSSGNKSKPEHAKRIRDTLHEQMAHLWKVHSVLKRLRISAIVDNGEIEGLAVSQSPFSVERDVDAYPAREHEIDLVAPIKGRSHSFVPLIRKSLDVNCSLSISFFCVKKTLVRLSFRVAIWMGASKPYLTL